MGQNDLWLSVALPRHHAGMRSSLYGKTDQWLSQHNPETSPEAEESGKAIEARPVFYKPRTRPSVGLLRHHAGCAFKGTAPPLLRAMQAASFQDASQSVAQHRDWQPVMDVALGEWALGRNLLNIFYSIVRKP
jgi:hypothetical protein